MLACLFTAHWEVGLPPSPVEFSSHAAFTSFPTPGCWARAPAPALSSQAHLVYLQFCEGFSSPPFGAQGTPPSLLCVFIVLIAYYSVSLFTLGGGRSVQGLC
jgi:hypothetical protein